MDPKAAFDDIGRRCLWEYLRNREANEGIVRKIIDNTRTRGNKLKSINMRVNVVIQEKLSDRVACTS